MTKDFNSLEFSYKGFWTFSDIPNVKYSGELKKDSMGTIFLTLLDERQTDSLRKRIEKDHSVEVINGYARNDLTKSDLAFTLYNNKISSLHISGLAEYIFECGFVTTYKHYPKISSFKIASLFLQIQFLNEWTSVSGLQDAKEGSGRKYKFSLRYEQPKAITLFKNKEFHIYLWFYANRIKSANSFNFEENARINIEFKKQIHYKRFLELYETIKNFLSFCISVPVSTQKIEFREFTKSDLKKSNQKYQHDFDIILSDNRTYSNLNKIRSQNMLIEYNKISNKSDFLKKWFDLNEKIKPVFKLYFDTLYNPSLYKENALLNNVAALEIYHRINNPAFTGKDDKYNLKVENIINQIKNKNDKEWLKARLDKKREVTLQNRLLDIVNRTPIISKRIISNFEDFTSKVSNQRHYLTHFDQKNKEKGVSSDHELLELIGKTRVLIQIQVLLDLGFTENETNELIKNAISNWYEWNK